MEEVVRRRVSARNIKEEKMIGNVKYMLGGKMR